MRNLAKYFYFDTQVGGGQDKLAWTAYPPPLKLSIQNNLTSKQLNLTWIMFIIDTSSQSDSLK